MEATQKKGFFKGKVAKSLSRIAKRTKIDSSDSSATPRVCTYSYASYNYPTIFHEEKNYVARYLASSTQKVSCATLGDEKQSWGHGDENVDVKATSYISNVRQRFNLDRVDSNGNNYQEMI